MADTQQYKDDEKYGAAVVKRFLDTGFYLTALDLPSDTEIREITSKSVQALGIDVEISIPYYGTVAIEQKATRSIWPAFYVETSNMTRPGWIYTCSADLMFYTMTGHKSEVTYIIKMPELKAWWRETGQYKTFKIHVNNTSNQTEGSIVPYRHIEPFMSKEIRNEVRKIRRDSN